MEWKENALKLKKQGLSLKDIQKKLGLQEMNYKTFQKALYRFENKAPGQMDPVNIKEELIKILDKGSSVNNLVSKLNVTERVINAYIQDLIEEGYNIVDDGPEAGERIKIYKGIIPQLNLHEESWNGDKVIRFGQVSDTHLCNKWQQLTFLNYLYDIFERENIKIVYHCGDLSDGFYKNRPAHIYELIPGMAGADAQAEYIIQNYPKRKGMQTKYITGNHDDSHIINGGVNIGKIIAKEREDMIYLGMSNARINITPNCVLELNHPGDGASYALSYTIQKLIDAMSGGDKPNILFNGHHHKAMYLFYRNIHSFEAGTIEAQTPFMKGKRISAHIGGWICEVHVDKDGTITRCKGEFIPLYKTIENDY